MRTLFIAGNWKMNLDGASARALAEGLRKELADLEGVRLAVAPPFLYIPAVVEALRGSNIAVAAQDCFHEPNGAFTGEVSVEMLVDAGCRLVICGHSERRHVIGEDDEVVARKVKAALEGGLEVILCVGELIEERQAGQTEEVLRRQVTAGLEPVAPADLDRMVIAYEPVWAIGTGRTATPQQAGEAHAFIRRLLAERYGSAAAQAVVIQYGGSVKPENAFDLMSQPEVDGALVGGASLKVDSFSAIVREGLRAGRTTA